MWGSHVPRDLYRSGSIVDWREHGIKRVGAVLRTTQESRSKRPYLEVQKVFFIRSLIAWSSGDPSNNESIDRDRRYLV